MIYHKFKKTAIAICDVTHLYETTTLYTIATRLILYSDTRKAAKAITT